MDEINLPNPPHTYSYLLDSFFVKFNGTKLMLLQLPHLMKILREGDMRIAPLTESINRISLAMERMRLLIASPNDFKRRLAIT